MPSTLQTTTYATVLPQDDDILYEVVDDKVVELGDCPRMSISGMLVSLRHAVRASDGRARGMPHSPWKARSCSCEGLTPSQGPSQPPESGPSSG